MTAQEFNERYPYGLKKFICEFQKNAYDIITSDEIDKMIANTKGEDKAMLKHLKAYWKGTKHWSDMHWILIMDKAPKILLSDIFTYMASKDTEVLRGEDIED